MIRIKRLIEMVRPIRAFFAGVMVMGFFMMAVSVLADVPTAGAVPVASAGMDLKTTLLGLLATVLALASGMVIRMGNKLVEKGLSSFEKWVDTKTDNQMVGNAMDLVTAGSRVVVQEAWQTGVKATVEAMADGKITKEEWAVIQKGVKEAAVSRLRTITPGKVINALIGQGMDDAQIQALFEATVESEVYNAKLASKAIEASAVAAGGSAVKN